MVAIFLHKTSTFTPRPAKCRVRGEAPNWGPRFWYCAAWSGLLHTSWGGDTWVWSSGLLVTWVVMYEYGAESFYTLMRRSFIYQLSWVTGWLAAGIVLQPEADDVRFPFQQVTFMRPTVASCVRTILKYYKHRSKVPEKSVAACLPKLAWCHLRPRYSHRNFSLSCALL
jgi:hypothetical protein